MTQDDEVFLKQLRATFKLEAQEHLGAMSALLLQLERGEPAESAARGIETLFREAHSLKGAARSVNFDDIERVCQALERVLSALKRAELPLDRPLFDTVSTALDGLSQMLSHHVDGGPAFDAALPVTIARSLNALLSATPLSSPPPATPTARDAVAAAPTPVRTALPPTTGPDTVRIATDKLDALMAQAEELQALEFGGEHLVDELQALAQALHQERRRADKRSRDARVLLRARAVAGGSINPRNRRLLEQSLTNVDEQELTVKALADRAARLAQSAAQQRRQLASRVDRLLDDVKQVLMLPLATLLAPMARLVRELAHDNGKQAELAIEGAALDVDRRILEQMKAPLLHLIRNAVDHGIEMPDERQRAGKPPLGRITIVVAPREGN